MIYKIKSANNSDNITGTVNITRKESYFSTNYKYIIELDFKDILGSSKSKIRFTEINTLTILDQMDFFIFNKNYDTCRCFDIHIPNFETDMTHTIIHLERILPTGNESYANIPNKNIIFSIREYNPNDNITICKYSFNCSEDDLLDFMYCIYFEALIDILDYMNPLELENVKDLISHMCYIETGFPIIRT